MRTQQAHEKIMGHAQFEDEMLKRSEVHMKKIGDHWEHQINGRLFVIHRSRATARTHAHSGFQYQVTESIGDQYVEHFQDALFTTLKSIQRALERQAPKYKIGVHMRTYGEGIL